MPDETTATRQDMEQHLISRAWKDPGFRQELLNNPREAIKREIGLQIPAGISIVIHEETPTTLHLILPVNPVEQSVIVLSDEALEAVAGGKDWFSSTGHCDQVTGVRG